MRTGHGATARRTAHAIVVLCLSLPLATCSKWETVYWGVNYSDDGIKLKLASAGSCACVTLQNKKQNEPLTLYASLNKKLTGRLILPPGDQARVRFDWAGPRGDDFYEIAEGLEADGAQPKPLEDSLAFGGYAEVACDSDVCAYGTLNMSQAAARRADEEKSDEIVEGVGFTRGNEVLEAAARRGDCGCMVLRNTGTFPVILRSMRGGTAIGGLTLQPARLRDKPLEAPTGAPASSQDKYIFQDYYVGFDWAGDLGRDTYVISAFAPPGQLNQPWLGNVNAPVFPTASRAAPESIPQAAPQSTPQEKAEEALRSAAPTAAQDRPLKIEDYVDLVGRMNSMRCVARLSDTDRAKVAAELLEVYKSEQATTHPSSVNPFAALKPEIMRQSAEYAAGVARVAEPQLGEDAASMALRLRLYADRARIAGGAVFRLPTGQEIQCPFGELNLDQMLPRRTLAPTAAAAPVVPAKRPSP